MEIESGGDKQIYEYIGHPVDIYSEIFQKEQKTMKERICLCLTMIYQKNLVKEDKSAWGESDHVTLDMILIGDS